MAYGFRIYKLTLTPYRKYEPDLEMDHSQFGKEGAFGQLLTAVKAMRTAGGATDETKYAYFRVDDIRSGGWVIAIEASGGEYGIERDVVDTTTHTAKDAIGSKDAVLDKMRFLLVVPSYGDSALLVATTRGRSHLTPGLHRALKAELRKIGVAPRLESDFTDEVAWNDFLGQSNIDVEAVELVQTHPAKDRTRFGNNSVAKAVVTLTLAKGSSAKSGVLKTVMDARKKKSTPKLTGLVGMKAAKDDDFDEQRVVYVQDGRRRKITVNAAWPVFVYSLTEDWPPSLKELLDGCRDDVEHLIQELGLNVPQGWWPSEAQLEHP